MNLTGASIKNNRVTILSLIIIIVLGLVEYSQLSRDSMPSFTVRVATIVTRFPGASPERIESLISEKIEKVIQEIPEVKTITSTNRTGISIINVTLFDYVNESRIQPIWDRARTKIESIRRDLPSGIIGPDLEDEDIGVVYGIFVGLEADGFEYNELKKYADELRDDLIALENASRVIIGGEVKERIYVEYENARLSKIGLSASQLQNIISRSNIIIPSGQVNLGQERIIVESSGNFESIDAVRNLLIPIGNGESVFLGDVANVRRGYISPKESIVRVNGNKAIILYVSLKENANIIHLGKSIDELLLRYNQQLPVGIQAMRIVSQDIDVQQKVSDFTGNLIQSIVIVLLVILVVLSWRAGLVIASLIPASMVLTFWLMSLFDVGLNQVTLASLIMALGLLVDNGIVIVESLLEKRSQGQSRLEAAVNSSKEFMAPLLSSTLTTCAAFLAFYLAQSTMGEIMGNIFLVITMTLLSSWILSFTFIPLFGVFLLKIKQKKDTPSGFDRFKSYYNRFLNYCLSKPLYIIIGIVILFALSLYGFGRIPSIFMPPSDRKLVTVEMELPLGTNINKTDDNIATLEKFIRDSLLVNENRETGVADWSSYIGRGPESYDLAYRQGQANSSYAYMLLNTTSNQANDLVIRKLGNFSRQKILDADVKVKRLVGAGAAKVPIEIRLFGKDVDELFRIADRIKSKLVQIPGTKNVVDNWGPIIKKVFIDIDDHKLSRSGLTHQDVALSLSTTLSGYNVGDYREGDQNIPITMKAQGNENLSYTDLENMVLFAQNTGVNVPLIQVADISLEWQYPKIIRRNLTRSITIESEVEEGHITSEIMEIIQLWMEEESKNWTTGVTYEYGGDAEGSNEAMSAIAVKLPFSLFIIILLLVIQFNSIRKASIILFTIPLAIIGATGGLLLTGEFFSFTAFLGIISLAGIIINGAIVLIDKTGYELMHGHSLIDSIKKAANDRISPILLTTLTTSCGMIPLWLGGGELWRPMSISIIFGLLFGTIILLIFVPVVFLLLFRQKSSVIDNEKPTG